MERSHVYLEELCGGNYNGACGEPGFDVWHKLSSQHDLGVIYPLLNTNSTSGTVVQRHIILPLFLQQ